MDYTVLRTKNKPKKRLNYSLETLVSMSVVNKFLIAFKMKLALLCFLLANIQLYIKLLFLLILFR